MSTPAHDRPAARRRAALVVALLTATAVALAPSPAEARQPRAEADAVTTASAGGPYTTPEGSGVTLSGSTTPDLVGATYEWDVDGDGQFDDATGTNPTVQASTLAGIGLGDGPDSSRVFVRASNGLTVVASTFTTLTVTNVAPIATFSNTGPVDLGSTADVTFTGQFDPSTADTTAGFRYAYDLDYDGDWEVGDGTYAGSSTSASATVPTSILDEAGTYNVNGRIMDKDGGFTDLTTTITVDPPPNGPPVADAGPDQSVGPGATVTLDGTGSTDPDADPLTYSWVQTAGTAVTLTGANTAQPTFTAPAAPATLTFELTACDDAGTPLCDTDTVDITVDPPPNGPPVADAGPDQSVGPGATVTLDGTGSTDPDADPLTYSWVQTAGTAVTLTGANTAQPTFTAPAAPATLTFELTACDDAGTPLCDTDTMTVTVNPPVLCAGLPVTVDLALAQSPTSGADIIRGTSGEDVIEGLGGNDIICGGGGGDLISGGPGADRIFGGIEGDELRGNAGNDIVRGRGGNDTLFGQAGRDLLDGGEDTDDCRAGTGVDTATACETTTGLP